MRFGSSCAVFGIVIVALATTTGSALAAGPEFGETVPAVRRDDGFYERLALDPNEVRQQQFLTLLMAGPGGSTDARRGKSVDLTPLAEMAIACVQGLGLPIVEHRDEKGKQPIAVSAQFSLADDTPDLKVQLGDRPLEPMGAFFPSEKGFRFSIVYPMNDFSLRFEAGEDSEFGSLAVAGFTWVHPSKRFAAGVGLHGGDLDNSDSAFGAIFQFRMNLR